MEEKQIIALIEKAYKKGAKSLNITSKKLKSLPDSIGKLTNLKSLNLYNNQLTTLPDSIGKLTNLTKLDLGNNQLTTLPDSIAKLTNLKSLIISDNQLTTLPDFIGKLTNLTSLLFHSNRLTKLTNVIGELTNLEVIGLADNQLTTLPYSIGKLTNLRDLYLQNNQLITFPDSISRLKKLEALFFDKNKFIEWPSQLNKLTELYALSIDTEFLDDLVRNRNNFPNLHLFLQDQNLTSLPDSIGKLANLDILDLSYNQLTILPDSIGKLTNLTELYLWRNQLTTLPDSIGKLTNLSNLDLSDNQLTTLPATIGKLTKLTNLGLKNNALKSPPPGIVEQGTEAVLKYLQELEKKSKKRYEAKLQMLGDGDEGKTCVSRALRGLKFKTQLTTRGVEVEPWVFSHPDKPNDKNKKITLNIWDFEGQEIHHQTHQFFLTEGALYVLVFKCREKFQMNRAEYWLDTIRARAPKSRVFLVITECEARTPTIPLDKLKNNYGDLLQGDNWYFPVGCADNKGIPKLEKQLRATAKEMPLMGWTGRTAIRK